MSTQEVIAKLKAYAERDAVAKAVFGVWAKRQRARHSVTVPALKARMEKEGFQFTKPELMEVLKVVSHLGFGHLETNSKGRVTAVRGIKTTLQSIGKAALNGSADLKSFKQRAKYIPLELTSKLKKAPSAKAASVPHTPMQLVVYIHNKPVKVSLPENLDKEETAQLITKLQEASA